VANLFYTLGLIKKCEEAYVKYIKLIETVFGSMALETSNCYYLMGIFYLEEKFLIKALACMKKALHIRQ